MEYAMQELLGTGCADLSEQERENLLEDCSGDRDNMYILTNQVRSFGAASILYPHMLDMVAELLHENYFVLPSSVHEVIIVPGSVSPTYSELHKMVREVNETQVDDEEILSDSVYYYHAESGTLLPGEIAEAMWSERSDGQDAKNVG